MILLTETNLTTRTFGVFRLLPCYAKRRSQHFCPKTLAAA